MAINFITHDSHAEQTINMWHAELAINFGHQAMPQRFGYVVLKASVNVAIKGPSFDQSNPLIARVLNEQWNIVTDHDDEEDDGEETTASATATCICSHNITKKYYIRNKLNQNVLQVGCDCLSKLGAGTQLEAELAAFQAYEKRGERKRRQCLSCGKFRIGMNQPAFKTQCKPCYKEKSSLSPLLVQLHQGKTLKQCSVCLQDMMIEPGMEWKDKCGKCYKQSMVTQGSIPVVCILCGGRFTALPSEKWKTKCIKCYLGRKA